MTKLLDRVDSAATKGAREQAAQSHASLLRVDLQTSLSGRGEFKSAHGLQRQKIVVRPKPKDK
jgi:hypothetical protein